MKKIIENVLQYPIGCETERFFGATTSLQMAALKIHKNIEAPEHEFIFHVLHTVSGVGLFRLHQCNIPHTIRGYDADEMSEFVADYIPYTLRYMGYDYKKLTASDFDKAAIWTEIVSSIDRDMPVLYKTSGARRWNVICGYDELKTLYGRDDKDHYIKKEMRPAEGPDGYLDNGYFYDSKWYEQLDYVLVLTPSSKTITFKSTLLRMCTFLENNLSNGFNENCLLLKKDDIYFKNLSDNELKNLFSYIDSILGCLMECSHHVSEAFGAVWKRYVDNPNINPRLQDMFSRLDTIITNTQHIVWQHWNFKPEGIEKYTLLRTQDYRNTLLQYLYDIAEDDKKALEYITKNVLDLIDDELIDMSV